MKTKVGLSLIVVILVIFNIVFSTKSVYAASDIIFSNQEITDITTNSVILKWDTSIPTSYRLHLMAKNDENSIFTTVFDLELIVEEPIKSLTHSYKMVNLKENTYYKVLVEAVDDDVSNFDVEPWNIRTAKDETKINIGLDTYHEEFEVSESITSYSKSGDNFLLLDWNVGNKLPFSFAYTYKDSGVYYSHEKSCLSDLSCAIGKRGDNSTGATWRVRLEGLEPGTNYYFRIYADGKLSNTVMEKSTTGLRTTNTDNDVNTNVDNEKNIDLVDNNTKDIENVKINSKENQIKIIEDNINVEKKENITTKFVIKNQTMYTRLKGNIILKAEDTGKAYYVYPTSQEMHYLGRPDDAFSVMREQGVGIKNIDLEKIEIGSFDIGGKDSDGDGLSDAFEDAIGTDKNKADSDGDGYSDKDELRNGYSPVIKIKKLVHDDAFGKKQKGMIFLQVEGKGEAWYINPNDGKRYFLGRPADAFSVMRNLGLGISNSDFDSMK